MARKRMIDPSIWADESFGSLSAEGKNLFIGIISNADDDGRLAGNALFLTSTILPYSGLTQKQATALRDEVLSKMQSITLYEIEGKEYLQLQKWNFYQKVDRPSPSKYPQFTEESAKVRRSLVPNRIEQNRIEQNRKENPTSTINYLRQIPEEDLKEFSSKYIITFSEIIKKAQGLINYCEMHGKQYKDYKAFLRNAISKDFQAREAAKKGLSDLI